jgi:hypothetical protein
MKTPINHGIDKDIHPLLLKGRKRFLIQLFFRPDAEKGLTHALSCQVNSSRMFTKTPYFLPTES